MPTNNPTINVTFEPKLSEQIGSLAKQEHKSASKLITELVSEALERREDMYLSGLAEQRETKGQESISHEEAWE